jgi:carbonic anhydrase
MAGQTTHRNLPEDVRATAGGQTPFGAIVSCIDSRVPVELVFDLTVGDVFSVRLAGPVVNRDVLGSLEFATKVAGAKLVVVLGHTGCGAVQGAIEGVRLGNLTETLGKIFPAVAACGPGSSKDREYLARVAERNVRNAVEELRQKSSVLDELVAAGTVRLAGGIYDVETGRAQFFDPAA